MSAGWSWRIANLLNRLPGQCWTDLVMWANNGRDGDERVLPLRPIGQGCRSDAARNGACWCSKVSSAVRPSGQTGGEQ